MLWIGLASYVKTDMKLYINIMVKMMTTASVIKKIKVNHVGFYR